MILFPNWNVLFLYISRFVSEHKSVEVCKLFVCVRSSSLVIISNCYIVETITWYEIGWKKDRINRFSFILFVLKCALVEPYSFVTYYLIIFGYFAVWMQCCFLTDKFISFWMCVFFCHYYIRAHALLALTSSSTVDNPSSSNYNCWLAEENC